jgi:hypothetical protein
VKRGIDLNFLPPSCSSLPKLHDQSVDVLSCNEGAICSQVDRTVTTISILLSGKRQYTARCRCLLKDAGLNQCLEILTDPERAARRRREAEEIGCTCS